MTYRSSGGDDSDPTYAIEVGEDIRNGTVTANRRYAERGDTVTITVKPDDGFKLDDLTVTDKNGNELKLTDKGNGKYTFKMPAGKVAVSATFAPEKTAADYLWMDVPPTAIMLTRFCGRRRTASPAVSATASLGRTSPAPAHRSSPSCGVLPVLPNPRA